MKTAFVYGIRNKKSGKYYVGSTRNLEMRWEEHKRFLDNGEHSLKLQKAWDKSLPEDWEWTVLEEKIPILQQFQSEQYWIDTLEAFENGYNSNPRAGSYVMIDNRGYDWFVKEREDEILEMLEMIHARVPYRDIADKYGVSLGFLTKLKEQYSDLLDDIIEQDEQRSKEIEKSKKMKKAREKEKVERDKKIIDLLKKNVPYRKIVKIVGCSLGTITNIKKQRGI
jgi:group I intron endonuclease